jgi:hypothetical protein
LNSLNPLAGHVSAICASYFFHLFSKERQLQFTQRITGLLSPEPEPIILGSQAGYPEKSSDGANLYCHSAESWKELWIGQAFEEGTVEIEAVLKPVDNIDTFMLEWFVTRI